ncbi:anhydro-N-acetylmuramic acid kinase [candidate division KSB1 bacterium]|nr:anhydro-N-acetylmuramic acid kinase [candidate division KSB1 bacterium]
MTKSKLAIGLMSGTSADGIDAVLVSLSGCGPNTRYEIKAFHSFPYEPWLRNTILDFAQSEYIKLDELVRFDSYLANRFAQAVLDLLDQSGFLPSDIDFIGSHGQTIRHLPKPVTMFDSTPTGTLQIGDPSIICQKCGITTVGDFRIADMAQGGQGAPLIPIFDFITLRSNKFYRVVLNIGGIANITKLTPACSIDNVTAFDTGPGNMLIDLCCQHYFDTPFDRDGKLASKGTINSDFLQYLLNHPYFSLPIPKSTGREEFGNSFFTSLLDYLKDKDIPPHDILATLTRFTVETIVSGIRMGGDSDPDQLIVSGGGLYNKAILNGLGNMLSSEILSSDQEGIHPDAKEAICFAILANETLCGHAGNVIGATGAKMPVILGKICRPFS